MDRFDSYVFELLGYRLHQTALQDAERSRLARRVQDGALGEGAVSFKALLGFRTAISQMLARWVLAARGYRKRVPEKRGSIS